MTNDAELLRLRNKVHTLEKQVWAAAGVGREHTRVLGELRDELHELTARVEDMTEAEKIQNAVAAGIRADRRRRFTIPRRLAGAVAAAILIVPAVHDLVSWIGTTT